MSRKNRKARRKATVTPVPAYRLPSPQEKVAEQRNLKQQAAKAKYLKAQANRNKLGSNITKPIPPKDRGGVLSLQEGVDYHSGIGLVVPPVYHMTTED